MVCMCVGVHHVSTIDDIVQGTMVVSNEDTLSLVIVVFDLAIIIIFVWVDSAVLLVLLKAPAIAS